MTRSRGLFVVHERIRRVVEVAGCGEHLEPDVEGRPTTVVRVRDGIAIHHFARRLLNELGVDTT
jgi:hypothetical protein